MLQQRDGLRAGRCWDGGPLTLLQPGGPTQVYPCVREWFQFVSFGDGRIAPKGALFSTIPSHIAKQIAQRGSGEMPFMCVGVHERGTDDELQWNGKAYVPAAQESVVHKTNDAPLSEFRGKPVITTQCSNVGAVIEWVFVPFINDPGAVNITEQDTAESEDLEPEL